MDKALETKKRANRTLAGAIILCAVEFGTYNILSNYIGGLCERLQADLTTVVLIFSIFAILSTICNIVSAVIINKVPMKIICLIGSISYTLFFVLMYFAKTPIVLYLGAAFYGISNTFIGFTVLQPLITWWHAKNTGKKISMLSISMAIAAFILSFAVTNMLVKVGFGTTVLVQGLVLGVITILTSLFLINERPDKYGLNAYGAEEIAEGAHQGHDHAAAAGGLTTKEAMGTYTCWAIMIAVVLIGIAVTGYTNNSSILYQSMGLDLVSAGAMISIYSVVCIFWNFLYGSLSDKMGAAKANTVIGIIAVVAFAVATICVSTGGRVSAIIIAVLIGVGSAFMGMVGALTIGTYFRGNAVGTLMAVGMVASSIGSIVGAPLASKVYTATGSFKAFMIMGVVLTAVALVLLVTATSKSALAKLTK